MNRLCTVVIVVVTQTGCASGKPADEHDSRVVPTHQLTISARTHPDAPDDFDVEPGAVVPSAVVEITDTAADAATHVVSTDESGRAVVMLASGTYRVSVTKDTHDPYCSWFDAADIEVAEDPAAVTLEALWVLCE